LRVLFATVPWSSHFYPTVPLAWALRSAGHEVRIAAAPEFTDTITQAGLTAVAVGPDEALEERIRRLRGNNQEPADPIVPNFPTDPLYELRNDERERFPWEKISWLYDSLVVPVAWILNDDMIDDLVTFCRAWQPDLVLCDAMTHAGAIAADAVGAAHARLLYWHDINIRMRNDFLAAVAQQPPGRRTDMLHDWYEEWAGKYGRDFSEELVVGHFAVNVLPERTRLDPHEQTLSLRYVPYNGHSVQLPWLYETPRVPRVLMTFGILALSWVEERRMTIEQLQDTLDSLADLDIELVITLADEVRAQLTAPANCRMVGFVPLDVILPTCSVVIHHGGAGSFNGTLVHGLPQLILEYSIDAPAKQQIMVETGAGLSIPRDEVSGPRIKQDLIRLMTEEKFREGAAQLQQEALAQPTPNDLVPELERMTARFRTHRDQG